MALTSLRLDSNELNGTLPSGIFLLSTLRSLDLSYNSLTGSIPTGIGNFTSLQTLRLSRNPLSGSLPSELGKLVGLRSLFLSYSGISGSLPYSIGNLASLFQLALSYNQLSGSLPASISSVSGYQVELRSNRLSGSLPSSIGDVKVFQLDLRNNRLSGSLPSSIGNLTGYLYLSSNQLSGSLPSTLANLIGQIDLTSNKLSGSLPRSLGSMTGEVILKSNQLRGTLPSSLGRLAGLLDVSSNQLSGTLPSGIGNLTGSLDVSSNQLTGFLPELPPSALGLFKQCCVFPGSRMYKLGLELSNNFLSGSCPEQNDCLRSEEYFQCLWLIGTELQGNCFQTFLVNGLQLVGQRPREECSYACGSDQATGPCQGKGDCIISGANKVPRCICKKGFVSPASDPGTCIPASAAAPPPPRQAPPAKVTLGVSFLRQASTKAQNRWSRYLSSNYIPQRGFPRWSIGTGSFWMAPGGVFLKAPADRQDNGTLSWWASRDQGACAACWAVATTDAIAAAQTIAASPYGGSVQVLSVAQVLGCSANASVPSCSGDYPTTALEYAAGSAILDNDTFQADTSCVNVPPPPAIIMYETVQFRGWFGLLLTLQKQPALVILEAGAPFRYPTCVSNLVFQDPNCYSGNLDHSVLVVGYDISTLFPYWVIRNSWGDSWCSNGYMRMAIQGGNGVCGMNVLPAYYPVAAPPAGDPCYTTSSIPNGDVVPALNPCGGGTCKPAPAWGAYSYTCTCPSDFVAVNNTVRLTLPGAGQGITQTCAPVDACGLTLTNPCSVGTCVNDGKGSYSCLCPIGYFSDTTADGQSTCSIGSAPPQLIVQPGVTCCSISATYNITTQQLLTQNPGLNCSALTPGKVVNTSNPSYSCAVSYTVTSSYRTFDAIAHSVLRPAGAGFVGISPGGLRTLNPAATCPADGRLAVGQAICLRAGTWPGNTACNKLYSMQRGDTCVSVTDRFFPQDPIAFYGMNPGLDCNAVSNPGPGADSGVGSTGVAVCVGSEPVGARICAPATTLKKASAKTALYVGKQGDTCASILNKSCKKFKDRKTFSAGAFLSTNKIPDCRKVKNLQFCCPV